MIASIQRWERMCGAEFAMLPPPTSTVASYFPQGHFQCWGSSIESSGLPPTTGSPWSMLASITTTSFKVLIGTNVYVLYFKYLCLCVYMFVDSNLPDNWNVLRVFQYFSCSDIIYLRIWSIENNTCLEGLKEQCPCPRTVHASARTTMRGACGRARAAKCVSQQTRAHSHRSSFPYMFINGVHFTLTSSQIFTSTH